MQLSDPPQAGDRPPLHAVRSPGPAPRRRTAALTAALLAPVLVACGAQDDAEDGGAERADASAVAEQPEPRTYGAGEEISLELTMKDADDGGRRTAFYSGYRPDLSFATVSTTCSLSFEGIDEFAPGATHPVVAVCTDDVTVEPAATEVDVIEGGAVRGTASVLLPSG